MVATSVAVVAAATIASQKYIEGPIHNDTPPSSKKAESAKGVRVDGRDVDEDALTLLVWGSNRYCNVCTLIRASPARSQRFTRIIRAHIISPDASDAAQIRSPAVASFLQDVALRDLAVHATHAACVDGRGDVYQWGDGFFGQRSASASGDDRLGKPVLTLQGKVRAPPPHTRSLRRFLFLLIACHAVEHHKGARYGIPRICAVGFWEGVCDTGTGRRAGAPRSSRHTSDTLELEPEHAAVGFWLAVG